MDHKPKLLDLVRQEIRLMHYSSGEFSTGRLSMKRQAEGSHGERGDISRSPAQRRNEVNFAGLLHVLLQSLGADIAVDGDGDVRPNLRAIDYAVPETRKAGLKVIDDLSHGGSVDAHLILATGEALQQGWNPDHSHAYDPLARISVITRPGDMGLWCIRTPTAR
jgi:hypothetical protein